MRSPELQLLTPENVAEHPRAQELLEGIKRRLDVLFAQDNIPNKDFLDVSNLYTEEIDAVDQWILAYMQKTHAELIGRLNLFVIVKNPLSALERKRYTKLPVLADTPPKKPTLSPFPQQLQRIEMPNT